MQCEFVAGALANACEYNFRDVVHFDAGREGSPTFGTGDKHALVLQPQHTLRTLTYAKTSVNRDRGGTSSKSMPSRPQRCSDARAALVFTRANSRFKR